MMTVPTFGQNFLMICLRGGHGRPVSPLLKAVDDPVGQRCCRHGLRLQR